MFSYFYSFRFLGLGVAFVAFLEGLPSFGQEATAQAQPSDSRDKVTLGERSPGFSKLELRVDRLSSGKIRVLEVDPEGPFKDLVKEGEIFDSFSDIPRPHGD